MGSAERKLKRLPRRSITTRRATSNTDSSIGACAGPHAVTIGLLAAVQARRSGWQASKLARPDGWSRRLAAAAEYIGGRPPPRVRAGVVITRHVPRQARVQRGRAAPKAIWFFDMTARRGGNVYVDLPLVPSRREVSALCRQHASLSLRQSSWRRASLSGVFSVPRGSRDQELRGCGLRPAARPEGSTAACRVVAAQRFRARTSRKEQPE